jgi:predicted dehydrogenase
MVKVGLIGIGGMGRMHYNCYNNNPDAQIVAICDVDERKRKGDWSSIGLNIDTSKSEELEDLSGIATYADYNELIADPNVELVDICLPTRLHAPASIAALRAGKDVFCEKPMAPDAETCETMQQALQESGKQLMIGHCLRYWPHYVKAHELMQSGDYGRVLYARFYRSGDTPLWSWNNWLGTGSESGGAVFDMHIHDVDTAIWWFGRPDRISADGIVLDGLPISVDANWRYNDGPLVNIHGSWDNNGGAFAFAFKVVMEKASISFDSRLGDDLELYQNGETTRLAAPGELAYQQEINDFVDCVKTGRKMERVTPEASRIAVEVVREEMRQMGAEF